MKPALVRVLCLSAVMFALPGCGGGSGSEPAEVTSSDPQAGMAPPQVDAGNNPARPSGGGSPVTTTAEQIRWPNVPEEIFFDDPLAIAADKRIVAGMEARATGSVEVASSVPEESTGTDSNPSEPPDKAVAWSDLITGDALSEEVTKIRNRFAGKVRSVADFNNGYLDIPYYAAELGALAHVATMHSDPISWKDHAPAIRDLAAEMVAEQLRRGAKSQKQVAEPFEKIDAVLRGNIAPDLPESSDEVQFWEVADFGGLMQRFDAAEKNLNLLGAGSDALNSNRDEVSRESQLLAVLAQVIVQEGYGYAEDSEFIGYSNLMTESAKTMRESAEAGDFEGFDLARSKLSQSCTDCHGVYR
ncbi:hypothetical protein [Stratiformator vulcanicus]|uniref:Cytochrome C n=1 Tax=Stratiformator vulcanicus TaxID=2527980 RepID=A0A517R2T9_9PLAN|nr:hypothetical protein [Stratiformator vulcanicus]QDT38163.1 hypothetical protein Pan189_25530 [Stratiformator vulcanicus]